MTFSAREQAVIPRWIARVAPQKGVYFRSVEDRYMDPRVVLNGAGAKAHGGRFAPVGTRAVYLSASDSGASKEVTARKARLGGAAQITTNKYPRVVYAVAADLERVLDLSELAKSRSGEAVRRACLNADDLSASMELGSILVREGMKEFKGCSSPASLEAMTTSLCTRPIAPRNPRRFVNDSIDARIVRTSKSMLPGSGRLG